MLKKLLCCVTAMLIAVVCAWGNVKLPAIYTDDMVLQRDSPIVVWGWAAPGEAVAVTLGDANAKAVADDAGAWQVELPALKEGENLTLTVTGKNTISLKNLIMGDLWLCSGQSNMEFNVNGCNSPEDIKSAAFPKIRCFKVNHTPSGYAETDLPRWQPQGPWRICSPLTVNGFTAVGYFFAREITQQTGVPIGIIDDNWGGTPIEDWLAPASVDNVPELAGMKRDRDNMLASFFKQLPEQLAQTEAWTKAAREALANNKPVPSMPAPPAGPLWSFGDNLRPFSLFSGMINPMTRQPIKGVLWYQGENNGGEGDSYFIKMKALIGGWRALWKQPELPFYYVQLASFMHPSDKPEGGDGYAKIRCAQMKALTIPHTGMASAIDIGETDNIHPRDKQDVGKRLALWALVNDYGKKDIVPSGPIYKEMKVEGDKIRISFDYTGAGLMVGKKDGRKPTEEVKDGKLTYFAIAGEDKKFVWADAVIDGNTVLVSSAQVPKPVAVRYAFTANPQVPTPTAVKDAVSPNPTGANLYNKDGLPASPFRTDNW